MSKQKEKNSLLIAETIKKHQNDFYRVAYSYVKDRDEALDIVQEAVYKALTSVDKIKDEKYLKTWLYRIVINTSISHLRKQKPILLKAEVQEAANEGTDQIAAYVDLHQAIDQLSESHKTVIILRYFEDLKIDQIAEVINTNVNTVKSRLYTAMDHLRKNVKGGVL